VHHYEWRKRAEISLRDLMDLTISEIPDRRPGYLITPLLSLRCVGERGFWYMVRALTETGLGERWNQEWGIRLEKLKRSSRIRGTGRYSWSKPCEPIVRLLKMR
jgi:hypothetical protein